MGGKNNNQLTLEQAINLCVSGIVDHGVFVEYVGWSGVGLAMRVLESHSVGLFNFQCLPLNIY